MSTCFQQKRFNNTHVNSRKSAINTKKVENKTEVRSTTSNPKRLVYVFVKINLDWLPEFPIQKSFYQLIEGDIKAHFKMVHNETNILGFYKLVYYLFFLYLVFCNRFVFKFSNAASEIFPIQRLKFQFYQITITTKIIKYEQKTLKN